MNPKLNTKKFSSRERKDTKTQISGSEFDLLIIGGGITGAGIALDAASRGLKVALVEKKDYAWGTSSRSTKLIHGGLRYLKQMEFKLVHEVGTERAIVHKNARHIVIPEKMLLPITVGGSLSKNMSAWALWVYDRLAGVQSSEHKRMLSAEDTSKTEPLLRKEGLKAGGLYFEYRTDDARLTTEVLKSAVELGAVCLNYAELKELVYDNGGKVNAAVISDILSGESFNISFKVIVNAAGPWVDTIRQIDSDGVKGKSLHLSKGVHIVVPRERLPLNQSVYFDVQGDSRMIFAIPRDKVTYLGTTDTNYKNGIDTPSATIDDVQYILDAANYMFPSIELKVEEVLSSWSGLRPLIHQEGKSVSELSRKDEIFYSHSGLISIAGGKLTGYRKMAEKIVNIVCKKLGKKAVCTTKNLKLSGADFANYDEIDKFINLRCGYTKQIELTQQQIKELVGRYGANTDLIIEKAFEIYPIEKDPTKRILMAELWYSVEFEQASTLCDFLIRRTGRLYFDRTSLIDIYPFIAEEMGKLLNWNESELKNNISEFESDYKTVISFRS